jgi:enterochelin esterase family protein
VRRRRPGHGDAGGAVELTAPLVSPLIEPADDGRCRVTVTYRNDAAQRVRVVGGLAGLDPGDFDLRRGEDGLWRRTYDAPSDLRTVYWFVPDAALTDPKSFEVDPLNPRTFCYPADDEVEGDAEFFGSLLELPDAPPFTWSTERDVPRGSVELHRFASETLKNERRVWIYMPPGFEPSATYAGLVVFDGLAFVHPGVAPTPTVLDNLIAAKRIPPVVAIFPDSLDGETRTRELTCNPDFNRFLADELLPWARERANLAERMTVGGSSFGGLASAFAALELPDVFDSALSMSGSFGWPPEGDTEPCFIPRLVAERDRVPVRFWLDAGRCETRAMTAAPSLLASNRQLRDLLRARGYDVAGYHEFPGGHDYLWWRETLALGLIALLG